MEDQSQPPKLTITRQPEPAPLLEADPIPDGSVPPPSLKEPQEQPPAPPPPMNPQHELLKGIAHNMFMDAYLQNIGYILLGSAIRQHEQEFNDPAKFVNVKIDDLSPEEVEKYQLDTINCTTAWLSEISDTTDELVVVVVRKLRDMLAQYKVVLGTLRIMVSATATADEILLQLVFVREK